MAFPQCGTQLPSTQFTILYMVHQVHRFTELFTSTHYYTVRQYCTSSSSFHSFPICLLLDSGCVVPDLPSHLHVDSSFANIGSSVSFSCDEGYYINGTGGVYCRNNRTWSSNSLPTCISSQKGKPCHV